MSMKNSNDNIGNRTRDLPTCRAVPKPTAPPRAPMVNNMQHDLALDHRQTRQFKIEMYKGKWSKFKGACVLRVSLYSMQLFKCNFTL